MTKESPLHRFMEFRKDAHLDVLSASSCIFVSRKVSPQAYVQNSMTITSFGSAPVALNPEPQTLN